MRQHNAVQLWQLVDLQRGVMAPLGDQAVPEVGVLTLVQSLGDSVRYRSSTPRGATNLEVSVGLTHLEGGLADGCRPAQQCPVANVEL